jgi:hypothetical protein
VIVGLREELIAKIRAKTIGINFYLTSFFMIKGTKISYSNALCADSLILDLGFRVQKFSSLVMKKFGKIVENFSLKISSKQITKI